MRTMTEFRYGLRRVRSLGIPAHSEEEETEQGFLFHSVTSPDA